MTDSAQSRFWYNLGKNLKQYGGKHLKPEYFEKGLKIRFPEVRAAIEKGTTLSNITQLVKRGPPKSTMLDTPAKVVFSLVMDALYKGDTRRSLVCSPAENMYFFETRPMDEIKHDDRTKYMFTYKQIVWSKEIDFKLEYAYK